MATEHTKVETDDGAVKLVTVVEVPLKDRVDYSRCVEHFEVCVAHAKKIGKWEGDAGLLTQLIHLINVGKNMGTGRPVLYKDFAPFSFEWSAGGMNGGLIYHGPHDQNGQDNRPTLTVSLTAVDGWSLHT